MFTELLGRSSFSFLRGASHPEELVARAKELGLDAIALCDRGQPARCSGGVGGLVAPAGTRTGASTGCRPILIAILEEDGGIAASILRELGVELQRLYKELPIPAGAVAATKLAPPLARAAIALAVAWSGTTAWLITRMSLAP